MIKLTKEVYLKLTEMSKMLNMPRTQCVNMLINQWFRDNKKD